MTNSIKQYVLINDLKKVESILHSQPFLINQTDPSSQTPIIIASKRGYQKMVILLLRFTPNLEIKNIWGQTALILAVIGGFYKIVRVLLQYGADPNIYDNRGYSPLFIAAQNSNSLIFEMLLQKNANINHRTKVKFNNKIGFSIHDLKLTTKIKEELQKHRGIDEEENDSDRTATFNKSDILIMQIEQIKKEINNYFRKLTRFNVKIEQDYNIISQIADKQQQSKYYQIIKMISKRLIVQLRGQ